ncbi:MAG: fibronectin type III domain-containing protein [Clostridia bacterium]|nr:fibronectin type III domain-containing protein [Clostridia bacterium]
MKGKAKKMKKIGAVVFLIFVMTAVLSLFTYAADDEFEKSIAAFPESYKPYLTELHEKYPEWEFVPFMTGLDWNEVVQGEYGEKSLVSASASSKIWKSHDSGDYNPETGAFDYKDGGFVQANRFAVEYFLDPRNFLTEDGIFQFEVLEFNENYSIEMIEKILKGSFMSNAKIEYLSYNEKTQELTTVKTDETYADVIYDAGRTYNINPCYLASKILNELGSDGSYSIYGDHPTYPGIYNFYNIGATDGSGAIARGLLWAKGGETNKTTYGRPWNTPRKSIMGGAQFLAEEYIAKGQYTGYLQRFNVNPDGYYKLYSHQYMTNLTGALSQGYSTYASYASLGMLGGSITFSIPVYENMSGQDNASGTVKLTDTRLQYGTVNSTRAALKTGPAKSYADVKASSGSSVAVSSGAEVKILSKNFTDSEYYLNILACPIWYKVSITVDSVTYQGYIDADFVDITTTTYVPVGSFEMQFFKTNNSLYGGLVSSDYRYCTVTDGDTVKFLKNGTVYITSYTSTGGYDKAKYTVSQTDYAVKGMKVTAGSDSVTVSLTKNESAKRYGYFLVNTKNGSVKVASKTANKYTFTNLESGNHYKVYARYVYKYGYINSAMQGCSVVTNPAKVSGLSFNYSAEQGLKLTWNAVQNVNGYEIYAYDNSAGKYTKIGDAYSDTVSFNVPEEYADRALFKVRAYVQYDNIISYSEYSDELEVAFEFEMPAVKGIKAGNVTGNSYTVFWDEVRNASYYTLYRKKGNEFEKVADIKGTEYTLKNLEPSAKTVYKLTATRVSGNVIKESTSAEEFSVATKPGALVNVRSTVYSDKVTLKWNKVKNADYYTVYLYENGKYRHKANVTTNKYTLTGLKDATGQKVRIRAYIKATTGAQKGDRATYSFVTKAKTIEKLSISNQTAVSYTLKWSASSESVNRYKVYKYNSSTKKYKLIATTSKLSVSVKNLTPGTTDKYYVIPYVMKDGKVYTQGSRSEVFSFNTKLRKTKSFSVSARTKNSITLKWQKVENATTYRIYQYDPAKGKYVHVANSTSTSFKVKSLKRNTSYKFKIRAIRNSGGVRYYGYYSSAITSKTKK